MLAIPGMPVEAIATMMIPMVVRKHHHGCDYRDSIGLLYVPEGSTTNLLPMRRCRTEILMMILMALARLMAES